MHPLWGYVHVTLNLMDSTVQKRPKIYQTIQTFKSTVAAHQAGTCTKISIFLLPPRVLTMLAHCMVNTPG